MMQNIIIGLLLIAIGVLVAVEAWNGWQGAQGFTGLLQYGSGMEGTVAKIFYAVLGLIGLLIGITGLRKLMSS